MKALLIGFLLPERHHALAGSLKLGTLSASELADNIHRTGCSTSSMIFHTLGYEQSEPEDYIRRLQQHGVSVVVDVRDFPISRKRGFSKARLRELLAEAGIDYIHLQTLGAPKDLRDDLRLAAPGGTTLSNTRPACFPTAARTLSFRSIWPAASAFRFCALSGIRASAIAASSPMGWFNAATALTSRSSTSGIKMLERLY